MWRIKMYVCEPVMKLIRCDIRPWYINTSMHIRLCEPDCAFSISVKFCLCDLIHTNIQRPDVGVCVCACVWGRIKRPQQDASKIRKPHAYVRIYNTFKVIEVSYLNEWFQIEGLRYQIEKLNVNGLTLLSFNIFNGNQWPWLYEANRSLDEQKSFQYKFI